MRRNSTEDTRETGRHHCDDARSRVGVLARIVAAAPDLLGQVLRCGASRKFAGEEADLVDAVQGAPVLVAGDDDVVVGRERGIDDAVVVGVWRDGHRRLGRPRWRRGLRAR